MIGVGLVVAAVVALVPMTLLAVWTWFGWSRPSAVLVLEGFQMVLLAPSWVVAVGAALGRQWWLAGWAVAVSGSHLAFCLPAVRADATPDWVDGAPALSVFAANVRFDRADHLDVALQVLELDADVVVLNESTPELRAALVASGVAARYPTVVASEGRPFGELLLTRLPSRHALVETLGGQRVPAVTVTVAGAEVRVFAVHVNAPKSAARRHVWRRNLEGLGASARAVGSPALYVGDFNSAPWHGPFRRLLAAGLTDAHAATGRGLTRSWTPANRWLAWLGPVMRLDHALFTDGLAVVALQEVVVPDSDHRGFLVRVAVRPDRA